MWMFPFQIMCNLLAVDGYNDPDIASINAGEFNFFEFCITNRNDTTLLFDSF